MVDPTVMFQTAAVVAIFVLGLLARRLLGGYATEKGKNLATKEDIAGITRLIEGTRSEYMADLERLKSALHVASAQQTAFSESQRGALLGFFHDCLELLERLGANLGDMPFDNGKSLFDHQQQTLALFSKLYVDSHRLSLYCDPGAEIPRAAGALFQHAWNARREFKAHFSNVKRALLVEEQALALGDRAAYAQRVGESNAAAKAFHAALDPHVKGIVASFQEYVRVLNVHLRLEGRGPIPSEVDSSSATWTRELGERPRTK